MYLVVIAFIISKCALVKYINVSIFEFGLPIFENSHAIKEIGPVYPKNTFSIVEMAKNVIEKLHVKI